MRILFYAYFAAVVLAGPLAAEEGIKTMKNIGMMFAKEGTNETLQPSDFAPLMMPTSKVLEKIASEKGLSISPNTIAGKVISFPLMRLDSDLMLGTRFALEAAATEAQSSALRAFRIAEFQDLFARFSTAPKDQIAKLLANPNTSKASTLVNFIIENARAYSKGGPDAVRLDNVNLRFIPLQ